MNGSLNIEKGIDWDNLTEDEFESLSLINKNQFEELVADCDRAPFNGRQVKRNFPV